MAARHPVAQGLNREPVSSEHAESTRCWAAPINFSLGCSLFLCCGFGHSSISGGSVPQFVGGLRNVGLCHVWPIIRLDVLWCHIG